MRQAVWVPPIEEYVKKGFWRQYSLGEELGLLADKHEERLAVVSRDRRVSYRELDTMAEELANGFLKLGIRPGDRVLVQLPNTLEFIASAFAFFKFGAIPIFTMPTSRESDVNALCALAEPTAYLGTGSFQGFDYNPMVKKTTSGNPSIRYVISDDGSLADSISLTESRSTDKVPYSAPDFRNPAMLLISGGTTGTPKLIPRRHADYAYNARAAALRCGLGEDSAYLVVLPAAHNFSLSSPGILGTLSAGGRIVLSESSACDEAFALIEKEKITITALVPALLNLWLEAVEWEDADISSLRLIQVGGSPLPSAVALNVEPKLGCKLQQVFGTAEGLICQTAPDDPAEVVLYTQGRPISEADELRFVDAHGNDVPPGEEGELIVRGPYTIQGYYRAPEVNKTAITVDGYYRTGDSARILPDGNIQVTGRIKDQINRSGEKLAPIEIENYLRKYDGIQDAAVVGIPDELLGERTCAWIIAESRDIDLPCIHAFLTAQGLPRHKLPDQLERIDAWPLTSVGKVNKRELVLLARSQK